MRGANINSGQPHRRLPALLATFAAAGAVVLALGLVQALHLGSPTPTNVIAGASPPGLLHVSADGAGDRCTTTDPCALLAALEQAPSGQVVELAAGRYGTVRIPARTAAGDLTANVVVRAKAGAKPEFDRLSIHQAHLSVSGVTVKGVLYLNPGAAGARLDRVHVVGGGTFVRANDVQITNSVFEGGRSIDGVQIGRAKNVLLQRNTIRNFDQSGPGGLHADCVQIFDSSAVTLRANRLSNCYNSAIIFSGGSNQGVSDVLIEANFVQGCLVRSTRCGNGNGLDLRYEKATDVTVVHNTFANSTVRLAALPGLIFDHNIVNYLSACNSPMTNGVVEKWNLGLCRQPAAVGRYGTRVSSVTYVDKAGGNLHVARPTTVLVKQTPVVSLSKAGSGLTQPSHRDIDGELFTQDYAGADQPARK